MAHISQTEPVRGENPLLWPALALLVVAVAVFTYYWDGHRYQFPYSTKHGPLVWPPPAETLRQSASNQTQSQGSTTELGSFEALKLPKGAVLNVPASGMEAKLVTFIQDSSKPADANTWFDFDRLLFYPGMSSLAPASREQLHNIAVILKVFDKVHVRIGGYTDNTGDAAANLKLSQARATEVMNNLVELGVGASRMDAKGYGSEHPVGDNATDAGRAQNRRISLRVTQK